MHFGGNWYFCHWLIMGRSQRWPDLRSMQADSHFFYCRIWTTIDKAWIVIRPNFNFQVGKCQGHSSKNRSRGHVTKIFENRKSEIAKSFLGWFWVGRHKVILIQKSIVFELWAAKHRVEAWPPEIARGYISLTVRRKKKSSPQLAFRPKTTP